MRLTIFLPLVFALSVFWTGAANAASSQNSAAAKSEFSAGVIAFQKNQVDQARTHFYSALNDDPNQVATLFNLGLVEQRAGKNGKAIAIWRKALALSPGYYPAEKAIEWTKPKLERAAIPHDVEFWESLHDSALSVMTMEKFETLTAVLFFIFAWATLTYLGRRRRAILDEKPLPGPPIAAILAGLFFVLIGLLSLAKAFDIQDVRATVVVKKIEARALPEKDATALFDLYEGLEVIVRGSRQGWIQVNYPGGATGWVSRDAVVTTNDRIVP